MNPGSGWFGKILHFVVELLHGYNSGATKDAIVEWQCLDVGLIPQDLTGQIVGKERYPTSIGTFSDVWKCEYIFQHHKFTVAVKTIRGHREDNSRPVKTKTLHDQVERWKTLVHKNVLPVYGTTLEFGPLPSLVCPWVNGGTLTHHLETHPDLSPEKRHEILLQICDGLCYLHSKAIMHGQLNGSNVLMDRNGNAYLADFGFLPVVLEFRVAPYLSTAIGSSVRWAAPELFEIPDAANAPPLQLTMHSDIYSFGSIMLQVLSGSVPYYAIKRDEQVLYAVARTIKPDRPQSSNVTDSYWEYIQLCWSPRRENRRPSATDVSTFLATQHLS
ncbi:kinase-like protein [Paxillus ammoniavirescens]|nr:kinase-like protein [Paxillus ammoniavirescens]